jgi:hypothetical protein
MLASSQRRTHIDLSNMDTDELRILIVKVERELEIRQFEEGLQKAVREYQKRDPRVIHL